MTSLLLLFTGAALGAVPGWREVGPERGHVVDAASGGGSVSVATRVGVATSAADLAGWRRDPRFPAETRRVAWGPGGVGWAAPAGELWRITDNGRLVARLAGSTAVDLEATAADTLIAAVRGRAAGVVRLGSADTAATTTLSGVDPWCIATRGTEVWVGTLDKGLWHSSDDGLTFEQAREGDSVTALGVVDGIVLAAFTDGVLREARSGRTRASLAPAIITAIADDHGQALLSLAGDHGSMGPIARLEGEIPVAVDLGAFSAQEGWVRPTGTWSLESGGALVGTFRQGPLRVLDGEISPARTGFRATVLGGAATDEAGRLLVNLMGTGTYLSADELGSFTPQYGEDTPVTDAIEVVSLGGALGVVDFDGVALLDATGKWDRLAGLPSRNPGRRSGMTDLAPAADGQWWATDASGRLWRYQEGAWAACADTGAFRLTGSPDAPYLITATSVLSLQTCATANVPAWRIADADFRSGHAEGRWTARTGHATLDGNEVPGMPSDRVLALAARGDEALVSVYSGEIYRCTKTGCAAATLPLAEAAKALGWLPDGRIWAAEGRGTILVAEGTATVSAWANPASVINSDSSLDRLYTAPWGAEGRPGGAGAEGPAGGMGGAPSGPGSPQGPNPAPDGQPAPGQHRPGTPPSGQPSPPQAASGVVAPSAAVAPSSHGIPWLPVLGGLALFGAATAGFFGWRRRRGG